MPIETTSLATIIGLMSNFMAERRATSDDEYEEFQQWLTDKRHKALLEELGSNHLLSNEIKLLLKENHSVIIQKLDYLNDQLSSLASNIDGFQELSAITNPEQKLPKQCIAILRTIDQLGATHFTESTTMDGISYPVSGTGKQLKVPDPRFIEDDLNTMVELGLLRLDYNSQGNRIFYITRNAVALVEHSKPKVVA